MPWSGQAPNAGAAQSPSSRGSPWAARLRNRNPPEQVRFVQRGCRRPSLESDPERLIILALQSLATTWRSDAKIYWVHFPSIISQHEMAASGRRKAAS